ncbi:MAG: hypothetical protein HOV87_29770 [Catenulispora sp.]|nr:hypothetical protein [Catenulispora sp.]
MRKTTTFIAAGITAAVAAAGVAVPAAANASSADATSGTVTIPTFDYSDCPQLPSGADPAKWRCEVMVADGTVAIGDSVVPFRFDRVTHAEGPMPDGTPGQVFGAFRAASLEVPGRQSGDGHGPKLWLRPRMTAVPDFYSQTGTMSLVFDLSGPRLGRECSIGTEAAPVQVAAQRVPGTTQRVSQDPPIIGFQVLDPALAVPEVSGCGRFAEELNRRFALPSPSGANRLSGSAFYSFKAYDQL